MTHMSPTIVMLLLWFFLLFEETEDSPVTLPRVKLTQCNTIVQSHSRLLVYLLAHVHAPHHRFVSYASHSLHCVAISVTWTSPAIPAQTGRLLWFLQQPYAWVLSAAGYTGSTDISFSFLVSVG